MWGKKTALWIPAALTWDKRLHDVVQERLELVRQVDVVNDHVVVAGLLDGAVEVWLPQAKRIAKRPLKLVIADHVAGRWNAGGGVGREADLVCPGFRLGLMAEPMNAQRAFDVIHDGTVPPCLPFPTIAGVCQVMMLRLAERLGLSYLVLRRMLAALVALERVRARETNLVPMGNCSTDTRSVTSILTPLTIR
jgi:hypothetical protein